MKKNNNKNKIIYLLILIVIIILSSLLLIKDDVKEEPLEKDETISAYDFIIAVLKEDQLWGNIDSLHSSTGFELLDENKAIFKRGKEGELTINFSENSAISYRRKEYCGHDYYDYLYFNQDTIRQVSLGQYDKTNAIDYESDSIFNASLIIRDTLLYYEEIFKEAGCPLLNMPEGTLASYKDLRINKIEYEPFFKNAIWNEDFKWDFYDEVNWLDNLEDIFNKDVRDSELIECKKIDGSKYYLNYYSPLFIVFTNKDNSNKYIVENKMLNSDIISYDNAESGFMRYIASKILELCYGYDAVYCIEKEQFLNSFTNIKNGMNKADFLSNSSIKTDSRDLIVTIYKTGDKTIGNVYEFDVDGNELLKLFNYFKGMCNYYDVDFPFEDDYLLSFYLYYNIYSSRILGLR